VVVHNTNNSAKNSLKSSLAVRLNNFKKMEFNPLYWFVLPGLILCSGGLYIGLYLLQNFFLGEKLPFGPTVLMVMISILGMEMAFTGILLHSISGLFRHLQESRPL
jgi:hypothetical protein